MDSRLVLSQKESDKNPDQTAPLGAVGSWSIVFNMGWELSGSAVECLTREGLQVRASLASLRCVLEQDTLILA